MKLFGYKVAHLLSPKRWVMVIGYWLSNKLNLIPIKQKDSIAFAEMVIYRSLQCPQCTASGKCIGTGEEGSGCGCEINGLYGDLKSDCDLGMWGAESIENWKQYKKLEGIKFEYTRSTDLK